jgi:hypothetical protein
MLLLRSCVYLAVASFLLAAQSEPLSEVTLLARIRDRAAQSLKGLPNYTCLEMIQRSERTAAASRFEPVDKVRLEVALIDGKERFTWPGAEEFLEEDLLNLVRQGATSTGGFALHARSVFLTPAPEFAWFGKEIRDGRQSIRYNYRVPRARSGFRLRVAPREVAVGYHGSFWVDAGTLDLVRLELAADDIPADLGITAANDAIEYQRVKLEGGAFLLPASEELLLTDAQGTTSRNQTQFTGCRQFTAYSTFSFGEISPVPETPAPASTTTVPLPAGLAVTLVLDTPIDHGSSIVGGEVRATVLNPVRQKGVVLVPKGAVAFGRIVEFRVQSHPSPHCRLRLQFSWLEFGGNRAAFTARLEALRLQGGMPTDTPTAVRIPSTKTSLALTPSEQGLGIAVLTVGTARPRIPPGLQLMWRTEDAERRK